jgi:chemotaxis protein CheX
MPTVDTTSIQNFMTFQLRQVFATMFPTTAAPSPEPVVNEGQERVSGSIGFAGETITGAVYLHLSTSFASGLAASMLGAEPDSLSQADVNDVVGELTNMLGGGLKSWFCDANFPCAVTTPAVIRGRSFTIESLPEVERLCLGFSSGSDRFSVEVHIKYR